MPYSSNEKALEYRKKNKERIYGVTKKYRNNNKDKMTKWKKDYYNRNKEIIAERQRKYKKLHKIELQEKSRLYSRTPERRQKLKEYHARPDIKIRRKNHKLVIRYGITLEQYKALIKKQKGKCNLCKNPPNQKGLFVDHNHKTGKVRSLLCNNCNAGIGMFGEDIKLLEKCIIYLNKYK